MMVFIRRNTDEQFYTISSGFRLRTPMPPYLPPAERSRQRLVEGIRGLDVVKRRSVRGGGRHLLFFAYALAMQVGLISFFSLPSSSIPALFFATCLDIISETTVLQSELTE